MILRLLLVLALLLVTAPASAANLLDSFNRANEGPPPSSSWTTFVGSGTGLKVVSNAVAGDTGGFEKAYWNPTTFEVNQEVFATVASVDAATPNLELFGCLVGQRNATSGTFYHLCLQQQSTDEVQLNYWDGTNYNTLTTCALATNVAAGQVWKWRRVGISIEAYQNGNLVCSTTDSSLTGPGNIGLEIAHQNMTWDDFGGGAACIGSRLMLRGVAC